MDVLRFSGLWKRVGAIVAVGAILAFWRFTARVPAVPQHPLRVGFESNPPVQIRTDSGFSGLGVETVNEAAKRAGIKLEWVETGTSSEEAFRRGLVDLWPLMVNLPDRRKYIHFARPWMHSSNALMVLEGAPPPGDDFQGRIAVYKMPLHLRLLHERFPKAQIVETTSVPGVAKQVCIGAVTAGFFEARVAFSQLREKPPECSSAALRVINLNDLRFQAGLASTFEAARAADKIQVEIDNMFRDGSLSVLIARYSYFGLDDTWASYERMAVAERWRLLTWVGCGLVLVAGVTLWLASSLRQRKRAEAALRESEGRFRSLANTAPVMIVASGPDGHATFFNKTWLDFTGRTAEQALGYGWLESVHPEDRAHTLSEYSCSLAAQKNCRIEYRLRRNDGEYRYVMCSGVPRLELDGRFAGYIASCLDLTEIKSAQEEALNRQHLESLGVLAGGIAHDFNNLLGGTLAYCELAQAKLAEGAALDDELRQIQASAIRGSEIVRQLMIFAGSERGTLEPVDVSSLVEEMLELLKVSVSKHAVLKTSLAKALPPVRGNSAQIRQVVMNLVTNASEAIGDRDGVIRVLTERVAVSSNSGSPQWANLPEGDYLWLMVSDTGCGMAPETQSRAFDPFYTTKFAGRGMGLAVVQQIVRQLGGAIHVVSSLGHGTTVNIALPCAAETAHAGYVNDLIRPRSWEAKVQNGQTILVVEDEPVLLAGVSKVLRRNGFSVIEAKDGSAGLEQVRAHQKHIDAMLLDITLPGVSSREIFEEADKLRPDLVVILTSAYSEDSVRTLFAGLIVEHFIRKPFRIDDLVSLLRRTLSARSAAARVVLPETRSSTGV
jgi:PAS domain S-box-containing protein